jgi:hypothetical protein
MKKIPALALLAALLHLNALSLYAFDFGVVFNQDADISVPFSDSEETSFGISGMLIPRFIMPLGETGDLYISAAVNYRIEPFAIIPELTRTDFAFTVGGADIKAGRMFYTDPLGFIADGLFDGAQFSFITGGGNVHFVGWYTGFLYRERAAITMTPNELQSSKEKVDYNDFTNTYFAPPRALAAVDFDHPSIAGFIGVKASIFTQFDTGDDNLNSLYFTAALSLPVKSFIFDLGGCFELIENNDETTPAFAAELEITWMLPAILEKHFKLSGRYSSGVSEDKTIGAFLPLTTVPQGELVEAKLSGLSVFCADFTGRLAKSLSANAAFTYFIRNDLGTYRYYPVTSGGTSEGFFLGGEIFGRLILNISSGIRLNFGTGVFLLSLGNAAPDADFLWGTKLNVVVSIY